MARQSVATQAILRGATQAASGATGSRSVVTQAVLSEAVRVAGGAACQSGERQASLNVATAATGDGEAEASRDETQATCAPWRKDECSLFGNRDTKPIRAARSRMQNYVGILRELVGGDIHNSDCRTKLPTHAFSFRECFFVWARACSSLEKRKHVLWGHAMPL